ncbi:MAG: aminotransferase class I/II-fold pyridoxal phosphate-dependent enzyme [Fusobacteriaceae bacterium]
MKFIADKHINRGSGMCNSVAPTKFEGKLIDLSMGDIDCHTDEVVIKDAFQDALEGHTHYTNSLGYLELRENIAQYHNENFKNYNVDAENIFVVSGGCHGMYLILQSIVDTDDEVIIFSPYFPVYKEQIKLAGGVPVVVELLEEDGFQIAKASLEEKITKKTKAIIVNTPSNPTGACYTMDSLNIIKEISEKYDLLVIADDIYDYYSFDTPFIPIYTLPDMDKRTMVVCSFSKNFAMTGWRVAYILGLKEIVDCANNINESIVYSTCSVAQRAAISALKNHKRIKSELPKVFKERIDYAWERINNIDFLSMVKPSGGIYLFVNIEKSNLSSAEFSELLYAEKGIKVLQGTYFGSDKHIRMSLIVDLDTLKEVFDRIESLNF